MDLDDDIISPTTKIPELFRLIDENKKNFIDNLKEAVSIQSISNTPEHFNDILKMLEFCKHKLEHLGASVDLIDGNDETSTDLPPVLFANLFVNEKYKTICVYGKIDVFLAEEQNNDRLPFELKEENGKLYGCGVSDNKAPLLCWFNALKMYKISKNEIPVNIKFVIEGTAELYSPSLYNAILKSDEFFTNVEYICLTIDRKVSETPCLKYGYRGICHCSLIVCCGQRRVHSGTFGGAFKQPFMDVIHIVGSLTDKHGKINIPHFSKDIKPITEMDEKFYEKELPSIESLKQNLDLKFLSHKEKPSRIFVHNTRLPSFTINSFRVFTMTDEENYAIIPNKVEVKFLIRLVVNQTYEKAFMNVEKYIKEQWKLQKSTNTYELNMNMGFEPWHEDPSSNHYKAAEAAIKTV